MSKDTISIGTKVRWKDLPDFRFEQGEWICDNTKPIEEHTGIVIDNEATHGAATLEVLIGVRRTMFIQPWLVEIIGNKEIYKEIADRHIRLKAEKRKANSGWETFIKKEETSNAQFFCDKFLKPRVDEINQLGKLIKSQQNSASLYFQWLKLSIEFEQLCRSPEVTKVISILSKAGLDRPKIEMKWDELFWFEETAIARSRQVLTIEYLNALGNYLAQRVELVYEGKPVVILDAASGVDMRLHGYLKNHLFSLIPGKFKIISVDNFDAKRALMKLYNDKYRTDQQVAIIKACNDSVEDLLKDNGQTIDYESLDVKDALNKYNPDIVITSWMPKDCDFTPYYRDTQSVKEYILIGPECVCGTWNSWHDSTGFRNENILTDCVDLSLNMYSYNRRVNNSFHSIARSFIRNQ